MSTGCLSWYVLTQGRSALPVKCLVEELIARLDAACDSGVVDLEDDVWATMRREIQTDRRSIRLLPHLEGTPIRFAIIRVFETAGRTDAIPALRVLVRTAEHPDLGAAAARCLGVLDGLAASPNHSTELLRANKGASDRNLLIPKD